MKRKIGKIELNRRAFLKTVAKSGLSSKFLQSSTFAAGMMLGRAAEAQTGNIQRVICVYIGDGAPVLGTNMWLPSSSLELAPATAPLEDVKQHCVFFENASIVDSNGEGVGGHGNTAKSFGGQGFSNSFDTELERGFGATSPFPSLQFGVQTGTTHGTATKKDGQEVAYQDDPSAAFSRLFSTNYGGAEVDRSKNILDLHMEEIATMQGILGAAEKERLDEHLASVEKLKTRIDDAANAEVIPECESPSFGSFIYDPTNKTRFTEEANLQVETAILAMKCNLTKVASIMFGNHQSEHAIPELSYTADYHQSIHGGSVADYTETRAYLTERLAYLISRLSEEGLLDSTLIIQSTDMGDGNAHTSDLAPVMMAGGGISTGKVVDLGGRHTNMFDTASEAMGISGEVLQFGTGPISGVFD